MNSRERLRAAVRFEHPDRLPFDLGSTDVSGIHWKACQRLGQALGIEEKSLTLIDPLQGLAQPPLEMLERLQVDTMGIWLNPTLQEYPLNNRLRDEWGTLWSMSEEGLWYEPVEFPLQGASLEKVLAYAWPDPTNPAKLQGVEERAAQMYHHTSLGLVANFSGALVARGQLLRGPADFLADLLINPEIAEAILDKVLEYSLGLVERFLQAVGQYIEVIKTSDDVGAQNNLLISPALYRRLIKPRQRRLYQAIHQHTAARLLYHTDGAVYPLIDDFIEIGVDILNPIQVSAHGMDTERLGQQYGGRLVFWGAVDNQGVISQGSPPEVTQEVRRRLEHLAWPEGGYVLAANHNIQPSTTPENILALCRASRLPGGSR